MSVVWPFLIIMVIIVSRPLGLVLYGLWPRLARTRILPEASPEASRAKSKYGSGLEAAGFRHVATLSRSLPLQRKWRALDIWASSSDGVFGIVLPNAGALMLVTYFGPGPGAVVSVDCVLSEFRRTGYWRESVLGLNVEVLLARHLDLARAFSAAEPTWLKWTDLTLEGFQRANRGFDGGLGRSEVIGKGLSIVGWLVAVAIATVAFILGFDWLRR